MMYDVQSSIVVGDDHSKGRKLNYGSNSLIYVLMMRHYSPSIVSSLESTSFLVGTAKL